MFWRYERANQSSSKLLNGCLENKAFAPDFLCTTVSVACYTSVTFLPPTSVGSVTTEALGGAIKRFRKLGLVQSMNVLSK